MNSIDNFQKNFSVAKSKNIVVFAFIFVLVSFGLFYGDFCMDLYSVDSDEAMKRGDEALKVSSLHFLRSVSRFIASLLQFFTQRETLYRR
jgi:capsule polysaccharide export protein KpsE/RkpR